MSQEFLRLFSRDEARRALPLVKGIVDDIMINASEVREYVAVATGTASPAYSRIAECERKIETYMAELDELGVYFKDWRYQIGLVDFPARIEGEIVFLCWRSDEEAIAYYHRIEDGYAGRHPLPPDWTGER